MTDCKKIAIIGWGSLIWCPKSLHKHIGEWQTGGPCLPIEFSRISDDGRLTLVIDEKNGEVIPTRFAMSHRNDLRDAICDLRHREGTLCKRIGYVKGDEKNEETDFLQSDVIRKWVANNEFYAAIWTALPSNFEIESDKNEEFSVNAATEYLEKLSGDEKDVARKYIENAPPEVCTPLRRHLYAMGWLKR